MPDTPNDTSAVSALTLAGNTNQRICTFLLGLMLTSSANRIGMIPEMMSALIGVLKRGETLRIHELPGSWLSREYEYARRDPAPCTAVPHEKNAMHTTNRNRS